MLVRAPGRLLTRVAALAFVWALTACGSGGSDSASSSTTVLSTDSTSTASTSTSVAATTIPPAPTPTTVGVTTAPPPPAATTPPPDPALVLQQALDAIAPGYHFVTNATTGAAVVLTAEGDRVGTGTRMTLVSQGKTVQYIVLPEGTWAAEDGGEWQELEQPQTLGDPIASLRAPQALQLVSHTPELTVISATYPGSALGLATEDPLAVTIELTGTTLRAMSYAAPDGSSVRADFSPLADATPITPPGD